MTDETKPKRIRGLKEREAAYRAGFADGVQHARAEGERLQDIEDERTRAARDGFAMYHRQQVATPKRTRRKREDKRGNEASSHSESSGPIDG